MIAKSGNRRTDTTRSAAAGPATAPKNAPRFHEAPTGTATANDSRPRSIGPAENAAGGKWPLSESPEPLESLPLWNFYYLNTCPEPRDPTIVWGTDVDCSGLRSYLRRINADSSILVTPAHLLVAATGRALAQYPQFNRRVLKGRIWRYRDVNIVMPFRTSPAAEPDVMFFARVDGKSTLEIAREAWRNTRTDTSENEGVPRPVYMRFPRWIQRLLQPFHVWLVNNVNLRLRGTNNRQRAAATMVNYLGHRGVAPLRSLKPSRLPYDSITLTVTMGAIEQRPVAVAGKVAVRPIAPLFVRGDHRLVDAHEIGLFAEKLRSLLGDPTVWASDEAAPIQGAHVQKV